jgi:ribose transport system ATP-binding protein
VAENLTLPTVGSYFSRGLLNHRRELRRVSQLLDEFHVSPPDPGSAFATLSGGNQQKVLVAKWLETNPKVLLMHEPTQGVDIGARAQIFARIRDAADAGTAVLLASSEYEDLVHLCDRVIIFRDGRAVSEVGGAALTLERLVEQSLRADRRTPDARAAKAPS